MERNWGNGDRAISPLRENREAGGRTNYNTESLVPFDPELSAELRNNLRIRRKYLSHPRLVGGEGGIRTPETLSSLHAFQACALNRARPPLRARDSQYAICVRRPATDPATRVRGPRRCDGAFMRPVVSQGKVSGCCRPRIGTPLIRAAAEFARANSNASGSL